MNNGNRPSILVVDDEEYIRRIVIRMLEKKGYRCEQASNGHEALASISQNDFALLITDIMMPEMSGLELLAAARKASPGIAVVMLTAVDNHDTAVNSLEMGAYGYVIKPFQVNELLINVANALRRRDLEMMRDNYEMKLEKDVRERTVEIRSTQEELTIRLMAAVEYRDRETGEHIRRIGLYAAILAQELGWDDRAAEDLRLTAPMHDVGKIGVPEGILRKPEKLTPDEFDQIKRHTVIGAGIFEGSNIDLLRMARDIAYSHHERWDGAGYPRGLRGEEIPTCARIVSVCDVYDSLVNDRVYRPAMPEDHALAIMKDGRGNWFDERVFDLFIGALPEFQRIRQEYNNNHQQA